MPRAMSASRPLASSVDSCSVPWASRCVSAATTAFPRVVASSTRSHALRRSAMTCGLL